MLGDQSRSPELTEAGRCTRVFSDAIEELVRRLPVTFRLDRRKVSDPRWNWKLLTRNFRARSYNTTQEFSFRTQLVLPRKRDEIFRFFADARNLELITPLWLRFSVLTPPPVKMHPGTLIDYKLRVHGIPLKWRSEITAWEPPTCFVDEQRRGPYRTWIHEHRFEESGKGTLCTDFVRYSVFGGAVTNWLFVRRDIEKIFAFRTGQLRKLFRTPAK